MDKKYYCMSETNLDYNELPDVELMKDFGTLTPGYCEEDAAKTFAERYQGEHLWYPDEMIVFVLDDKNEIIYKFTVYVRMESYYYVASGPKIITPSTQKEK